MPTIEELIARTGGHIPLTYLVLDGHFGNNGALQMARQCNLHLISKLRADSALYRPMWARTPGRGHTRILSDKILPRALPERYLCQTTVDDGIETRIYQLEARHTIFAQLLNEDFVITSPTAVTNAAILALFMVNLVERMLRDRRPRQPPISVLDLKTQAQEMPVEGIICHMRIERLNR